VIIVKAGVKGNHQKKHQTAGDAQGKAKDVDGRIAQVPLNVSNGDGEIIF